MAKKIATVPKGYKTATPTLIIQNAASAIAFYEAVFSATTQSCAFAPDGTTVLQADLKIGTSIIRLGDEMPEFGIFSPLSLGGSPTAIHLYVESADDVWEKALEAGATVAVPLADTYWGERYGRIVDPFGHVWSIAQRLEILTPAEVAQRADALFGPAPVNLPVEEEDATPVEGAAYVVPEQDDSMGETETAAA